MRKSASIILVCVLSVSVAAQEEGPWYEPFLSAEQYWVFSDILTTVLRNRGIEAEILPDGALELRRYPEGSPLAEAFSGRSDFYLESLVRYCGSMPEENWEAAAGSHFDQLEELASFTLAFAAMENDWDAVKDYLSVSLQPDSGESPPDSAERIVRRQIPSLSTSIVFDLPLGAKPVSRSHLAAWGKSEEDVFAAAFENLRIMYPYDIDAVTITEGVSYSYIFDPEDFYHSSHIFSLFSEPGFAGAGFGTFFSLPTRSTVLFHPLADRSGLNDGFYYFYTLTDRLFQAGPGALSPAIFWKYGDRIEVVPVTLEEGSLKIAVPEALQELLR